MVWRMVCAADTSSVKKITEEIYRFWLQIEVAIATPPASANNSLSYVLELLKVVTDTSLFGLVDRSHDSHVMVMCHLCIDHVL